MIDELYRRLRSLLKDDCVIEIRDRPKPKVVIVKEHNQYHWVSFVGIDLESALQRAVWKLKNPDIDYIDEDGAKWEAQGTSVYGSDHVRSFLKG